jgi:endonuclease YncB( thermonuclease family)
VQIKIFLQAKSLLLFIVGRKKEKLTTNSKYETIPAGGLHMKRLLSWVIVIIFAGGGLFFVKEEERIEEYLIPCYEKIVGLAITIVKGKEETAPIPALPDKNITLSMMAPIKIPEDPISAHCYRVTDGDTIRVILNDGTKDNIRLVGIDTPEIAHRADETSEPGGEEAKEFVRDQVLGKTVYLDIDNASPVDYYGRTLALVYLASCKNKIPSNSLNAILIQKGYAKVLYIGPSEFDPFSW